MNNNLITIEQILNDIIENNNHLIEPMILNCFVDLLSEENQSKLYDFIYNQGVHDMFTESNMAFYGVVWANHKLNRSVRHILSNFTKESFESYKLFIDDYKRYTNNNYSFS